MKKIIYIVVCVAIAMKLGYIPNPFGSEPDLTDLPTDSVILYSTSWCGYCQKTRELLKAQGIQYTEYDIETSTIGREQYDKLNGKGIPLMLIYGDVVRGYNPQRIKQLANNS